MALTKRKRNCSDDYSNLKTAAGIQQRIQTDYQKMYSLDLVNNLFKYPYIKIEFLQRDLRNRRSTAIRYLEALVTAGILTKQKTGKDNFYLNRALFGVLKED